MHATLRVTVLLALAGLAIELPSRAGVVVVVADRSVSMPKGADVAQAETIRAVESQRSGESRVGVVSFGAQSRIELLPEGGAAARAGTSSGPSRSWAPWTW